PPDIDHPHFLPAQLAPAFKQAAATTYPAHYHHPTNRQRDLCSASHPIFLSFVSSGARVIDSTASVSLSHADNPTSSGKKSLSCRQILPKSSKRQSMCRSIKYLYEFGPFTLDCQRRLLLRGGVPVPLSSKAFEVLLVLIQHRGEVLEKEELIQKVWPNQIIEDANLTVNMSALRKALGETPN